MRLYPKLFKSYFSNGFNYQSCPNYQPLIIRFLYQIWSSKVLADATKNVILPWQFVYSFLCKAAMFLVRYFGLPIPNAKKEATKCHWNENKESPTYDMETIINMESMI